MVGAGWKCLSVFVRVHACVCVEGNFCTVLLVEEEPVDGGGGAGHCQRHSLQAFMPSPASVKHL